MRARLRVHLRLWLAAVLAVTIVAFVNSAAASHVPPSVHDVDMANLPADEGELTIVTDPNDPNHLAAGANQRPGAQHWYVSRDGGRTWSDGALPFGTLTVPLPDPTMSDPALDFGSSAEIYYSALMHAGNPAVCTLFVTVSSDNGANWSDPANGIVAAGTTSPLVCHDKEEIAVDRVHNDNVYVVWNPYGDANSLHVAFSRDLNGISDGLDFSAATRISDPSCRDVGPDIAVAGNALYVAWTTFCPDLFADGDAGTVYVTRSADQGAHWSTPAAAATLYNVDLQKFGFRSRSFPSIDVDPATGRLFVTYATYSDVANKADADVMLVSSPDGSAGSWTQAVPVNQNSGTSDQWMPWVAAGNGRVNVCFYTSAYDGGNINLACSYGPASAAPSLTEIRVSSASTPPVSLGPTDYIGASAGADEVLHAAWADGRSGVGGVTDAYAARVDFSPPTTFGVAPLAPSLEIGSTAHFTATVTGAHGEPEQFIPVAFALTSSGSPSPVGGTGVTGPTGTQSFSYTNALPGTDTLHVFVDLDEDGIEDARETIDTTVTWQLPASTNGARVTGAGTIAPTGGGVASFALSAQKKATEPVPKGTVMYTATGLVVASTAITAVVATGGDASIFGTATVNGAGGVAFRVDVVDGGEPSTGDRFRIRLAGGYDSGLKDLTSGNITTH